MSSTKAAKQALNRFTSGPDGELLLRLLAYFANNQALSNFAITNGAGAVVFKTGAAGGLAVAGGILQKIAASTNLPVLTGLSVPDGSKVQIAFVVSPDGTRSTVWGAVATTVAGCTFPDIPLNNAILGGVLLENGSGSGFTGNTTALDTASITLTYSGFIDLAPIAAV